MPEGEAVTGRAEEGELGLGPELLDVSVEVGHDVVSVSQLRLLEVGTGGFGELESQVENYRVMWGTREPSGEL